VLSSRPSQGHEADLRLVVHDYSGHPGQIHLSRELARRGHHVEHQYCGSYTTGRGATERREGDPESFMVRSIELNSDFARYSPIVRLRQELQYARLATRAILTARPDVAVLSNIPLLSLFILTLSLRMRRMPYVFWQQDIYSEAIRVIARDRFGWPGRLIGWVAGRVERQVARGAAAIVALSDTFVEQLEAWGVQTSRIHVVPNWAAIDEMPLRPRDNAWAKAHDLVGIPVVMYAGTLGAKHDPSVISRLAQTAPTGSRMVVVSEGRGREWLESEAGEVPGLTLLDYQPYDELPDMLASADVLLVVLESNASRYSVPSKVLNYFCAGRPVLALLPQDNAVAKMVEAAEAGLVVAPGDADAASAGLRSLLASPVAGAAMGTAARRYAERTFDVERVGDRFESLLNDVCNGQVSLPDGEGGRMQIEIVRGPRRTAMSKSALGIVALISFVAGIAFGHGQPARSDTANDDTAALQAMFNNVQPGATLTLDRRVYPHSGVVILTVPNVHIEGNGATLAATNDLTSAVEIRANGVSVSNLNLTAPIGGTRYSGLEQQKLYVLHADGVRLNDITITGSAGAGVLLDGASNFVLNRVTVRDSRADGIHMTRGSNNGQVNNPLTERTGDDGIAVVSYGPKFVGVNEPPCHNITIESPVVNGTTFGHGVTVRGGENITYRNVQVSGTSGAGVFVDTEGGPFFLQSVNGATIEGGTVTAANKTPGEATGAVVAYGENPESVTGNVTFSGLTIVNTSEPAQSNIAVVVANGGAVSNIVFRNIAIQQQSQKPVLFANAPRATYTLSGITVNGSPYDAS
jgi:colanic acid biosynthesis glycosyl transferase WcaI